MPNLSILWKAVTYPNIIFASPYVVDQNNNSTKHFPFLNDFDFNFVNKNIPNIINFDYQIIIVSWFNILKMSYSKNFNLIRSQHSTNRSQGNIIIIFGRNNNCGSNLTYYNLAARESATLSLARLKNRFKQGRTCDCNSCRRT